MMDLKTEFFSLSTLGKANFLEFLNNHFEKLYPPLNLKIVHLTI